MPHAGRDWETDVACTAIWQVGRRLPGDYWGCADEDGNPASDLLAWCQDKSWVGRFVYDDMVAGFGQVIRKARTDLEDRVTC